MPVTVVIRNVRMLVTGDIPKDLRDEIQSVMSYVMPGYKYTPRYQRDVYAAKKEGREPWDGAITVAKWQSAKKGMPTGGIVAPTGLLSYLKEILRDRGVEYTLIDERPNPTLKTGYSLVDSLSLRDYQETSVNNGLKRGRGIFKASTGCHRIGQKILMYSGETKRVEQISEGELLMGPDSRPRRVLRLIRGRGKMHIIIPKKGKSFVVNEDHILTLERTGIKDSTCNFGRWKQKTIDVSVKDWLKWGQRRRHYYKLFRVGIDFPVSCENLSVSPYLVGLLLGDGTVHDTTIGISNTDNEVIDAFKLEARNIGLEVHRYDNSTKKDKCPLFCMQNIGVGSRVGKNKRKLISCLQSIGLHGVRCHEKFIPQSYKTSSREDRLQLLAGIIDTDGCYSSNVYDFISASSQLSHDVAFVARSCGFSAYIKPCRKRGQTGAEGIYFRVSLSGDIDQIPCRIPRKRAHIRKQKKNVLRTGFQTIPVNEDDYYGFELDGDGRYLLDDFTVTHNSGKTECAAAMIVRASVFPAIFFVPTCDLLVQAHRRFSRLILFNGGPANIGMVGNGKCDIQDITVATVQSCQRALTGEYTKFDEDSSDDKTSFDEDQKAKIKALVTNAQHILVDEAQHVSCETIQSIMSASEMAWYRFGMSASPWRDDGLDILIEAAFGRRFCDINASSLIEKGFLVKPIITFNHFNQALGLTATYNAHYTKYVVENEARNQWIAKRALFHMEKKRPTIILVKWVKHAEALAKLIPGAEILTASGKSKKSATARDEILTRMREGKLLCIIGTTLLDEGVDVPCATVGIFAGGGKSSTRALQRVGRFIRIDKLDPLKDCAYIEEFYDHTKWLRNHAQARRRILETEPAFEIGDNRATMSL